MSSTGQEEATINPDGSTSYTGQEGDSGSSSSYTNTDDSGTTDETMNTTDSSTTTTIDPAIYLLLAVFIIGLIYYFVAYRKKKSQEDDAFFANLDGDKFNLNLPDEVDEYYTIKEKCEAAGWEPGQGAGQGPNANPNGPSRILAQALMKRAIADIPIVSHIQKESAGMNKLYSQSMCSVKQWKSYQAAEMMVSSEVEQVRAEADEIEPGWSQVIWRQAMQYHNVLKQKHEADLKAAEEQAQKLKEQQQQQQQQQSKQLKQQPTKAATAPSQPSQQQKTPEEITKEKELAAERAAQELIKQEEREKQSKKSFKAGTMKKGFLDKKGKK